MKTSVLTIPAALAARAGRPEDGRSAPAAEVLRAAEGALSLLAPLLPEALPLPERRRRGVYLGRGAAVRVRAVLRALAAEPALFQKDGVPAEALRERQARAAAYRHLGVILLDLGQRAQDSYLREQAAAAEEAQRLALRLRHAAAAPGEAPSPALHRKALLLGEALTRRPGGRPRR